MGDIYTGVNGVARKVSSMYVSAPTEIPIYGGTEKTITVTPSNIDEIFSITNDEYYFTYINGKWKSNNVGVQSSQATTRFTAKKDCVISFSYNVDSENNYDKLTIYCPDANHPVVDHISGSDSGYRQNIQMTAGQTLTMVYSKDHSQDSGSDSGYVYNITATFVGETVIGYETKNVARKVKKLYIGDENGIAKKLFSESTTVLLNGNNVSDYFDVGNNPSYCFHYNDDRWESNNVGINDSVAITTFIAKQNCSVSFDWYVSSEKNYDQFYCYHIHDSHEDTIINGASGVDAGSANIKLQAGETMKLRYYKDSSQKSNSDAAWIKNFTITY